MRKLSRRARRLSVGAALAAFLAAAQVASAQDALMTESPLGHRGVALTTYPVLLPGGENEAGAFGRLGYGLTDDLAVRAHIGYYNDLTYLGVSGVLEALEAGAVDVSVGLGLHHSRFDEAANILGFDIALVGRRRFGPSVLYAALDVDLERPEEPFDSFTRAHGVAGLERSVFPRVGLLLEGGLGLNDSSPHYLSAGLVLRLR